MKNELMSHDPCPAVKFAVTNVFLTKTRIQYRKLTTWSTEKKTLPGYLEIPWRLPDMFLWHLSTRTSNSFTAPTSYAYFTKKGSPVTFSTDVPAFRFPPSGWHWPKDVPSSCHRSVCNTLGQRLHNCSAAEQAVKGDLFKTETKNTRIEETTWHMFYCSSSMCQGLFYGQPHDLGGFNIKGHDIWPDLTISLKQGNLWKVYCL